VEILDFQAQTSAESSSPVGSTVEILDFQAQTSAESSSPVDPAIELRNEHFLGQFFCRIFDIILRR
jgi:hypothetical protein